MSRMPDQREFRPRSSSVPWVALTMAGIVLGWVGLFAFAVWYVG
jgi:hypothetical protein